MKYAVPLPRWFDGPPDTEAFYCEDTDTFELRARSTGQSTRMERSFLVKFSQKTDPQYYREAQWLLQWHQSQFGMKHEVSPTRSKLLLLL